MTAQTIAASAPAPPGAALQSGLRAAAVRIRLVWLVRALSLTILIAAALDGIGVALGHLGIVSSHPGWWLAVPYALAIGASASYALLRRLRPIDVARATERRAGLNERLSSVLELSEAGNPLFVKALRIETDRRIAELNLRAIYPIRIPRTLPPAILVSALWLGALFLPALRQSVSASDRRDAEQVKQRGAAIEKLARDTLKTADTQKLDETRKAAAEAKRLGEAMRRGELSKKQSLVALDKLTRKMAETERRMAAPVPAKSMDEAQKQFQQALERNRRAEEALQRRNAEAKHTAGAKSPEQVAGANKAQPKPESAAAKEAKHALEQMREAMRQHDFGRMRQAMKSAAAAMRSGQMSASETQQMASSLQQLGSALSGTTADKQGRALQQLGRQMQEGSEGSDSAAQRRASEEMDRLAEQMGRLGSREPAGGQLDLKTLESLRSALAEGRLTMVLGRDGRSGGGRSKGPGSGWFGFGDPHKAMRDPGMTKAKLLAAAQGLEKPGQGRKGSPQELAKYLSHQTASPKYLPNGKIAGTRAVNGQELQKSMTGDPDPVLGGSSYYQVYETDRRAAESALNKENIPAAYKKQVHDYFETIRP